MPEKGQHAQENRHGQEYDREFMGGSFHAYYAFFLVSDLGERLEKLGRKQTTLDNRERSFEECETSARVLKTMFENERKSKKRMEITDRACELAKYWRVTLLRNWKRVPFAVYDKTAKDLGDFAGYFLQNSRKGRLTSIKSYIFG